MLGYIRAHWEGRHSLTRSVLANGVLIYFVLGAILVTLVENFGKNSSSVNMCFGFITLWALWSLVGIIRSAIKQFRSQSSSVTKKVSAIHAIIISLGLIGPAALAYLVIVYTVFKGFTAWTIGGW